VLSELGKSVDNHIGNIEKYYDSVSVINYVIMPNHVHIILAINQDSSAPRSKRPTSLIPRIIAALKKYSIKKFGENIWQRGYHDHIIRNDDTYNKIYDYIENNPSKWHEDRYYE
jgi:REP element-mobilizing transposase RayT